MKFGRGPAPPFATAPGEVVLLDQFYTRPDLAERLAIDVASRWPDDGVLFVEPSAGRGAFVHPLLEAGRKVRAMDMEPMGEGIGKGDFLMPNRLFDGRHSAVVVLGNPPFGKNASTAVKFFNRAAEHADEIAFIVPRTFRKVSLQARLDLSFHLAVNRRIPDRAFILDGSAHDVPCAWQIWTRKDKPRRVPCPPNVDHLLRYTVPDLADFAMRRVGFYAGRVITDGLESLSRTTHYFMKAVNPDVIEVLRGIDWTRLASQTAGSRSLAKREIATKLNEVMRVQPNAWNDLRGACQELGRHFQPLRA